MKTRPLLLEIPSTVSVERTEADRVRGLLLDAVSVLNWNEISPDVRRLILAARAATGLFDLVLVTWVHLGHNDGAVPLCASDFPSWLHGREAEVPERTSGPSIVVPGLRVSRRRPFEFKPPEVGLDQLLCPACEKLREMIAEREG